MDSETFLAIMIAWAAVGGAITTFIYRAKGRSWINGALVGAVLGALGGAILLIPLWLFIWAKGSVRTKICPQCAEKVKEEARICKHCGYQFNTNY